MNSLLFSVPSPLSVAAAVLVACLFITAGAKDTTPLPPAPPPSYGAEQMADDLRLLAQPAQQTQVLARLLPALMHRCFGGAPADAAPAFQHPRIAQALWLALMTDAVARKVEKPEPALDQLNYLLRQKALDEGTVNFFADLWRNQPQNSAPLRASSFLRAWIQPHRTPPLSAREEETVAAAVKAGMRGLDFLLAGIPNKK